MADRLNELKQKYQSVLKVIEQEQVRLQNLHVDNNKLFIRGEAPSQAAKNKVWDQVKLIDPNYQDLTADITVNENTASQPASSGVSAQQSAPQTGQHSVRLTPSNPATRFPESASASMEIPDST